MRDNRKHVFIVGSKGIPASYGGFETFVDRLTYYKQSEDIVYHVACLSDTKGRFLCHGADCFRVKVPNIGAVRAIWYDVAALSQSIRYVEEHPEITQPIFYVLACRIGPFIGILWKKIVKIGGTLYVNPDGLEWKRGKWSWPVRKYWKLSAKQMIKRADILICDSVSIEKYIRREFAAYEPKTVYISYGSETRKSSMPDDAPAFVTWLAENGLTAGEYYLVVGRFVPENNYETIIREFMASGTKKKLAVITTENERFMKKLERKLHFGADARIVFTGSVYDTELLMKIRENAYAYIHGHEVGGTNPSLLESLGSTSVNMLCNVSFNREVGRDAAFYWTKDLGSLSTLINQVDVLTAEEIAISGEAAKSRIRSAYSWERIAEQYEDLFHGNLRVSSKEY